MARRIKITRQVRVRGTVRVQQRTQHTARASFASWSGPPPEHTTNHYGDVNTISGTGHQVAIGVEGSVVQSTLQLTGPTPVDPDRLATAARELLAVLDALPADDQTRAELRADADDILDETEADEPDPERLRERGGRIAERLGAIGTGAAGGLIAQVLGRAVLTSLGM